MVDFTGTDFADKLFIGEAPGKDENRKGSVFVGKTGEEVNTQYLPLAGLRRRDVYMCNTIACMPTTAGGKLKPDNKAHQALAYSCAQTNLYPLIERGHWTMMSTLGRFAVDAVRPHTALDHNHGIPLDTDWGIPLFPMYHPALGIHEPKKMMHIRGDWYRLGLWLTGRLPEIVDVYTEPDYQEVTDVGEIEALDIHTDLGGDTESTKAAGPYCLTYSMAPGSGRLIKASRRDLLMAFAAKAKRWKGRVIFHNWPYDAPIVDSMGVRFPNRVMVDTMSLAYQLGNLPQGLKALGWRELRMEMDEFMEVVGPYSRALVLAYYRVAATYTWPKPDKEYQIDPETGDWKEKNPQSMSTKLKRFFTDLSKDASKDVFKMWHENWPSSHEMLEETLGPWPGLCISHVPFDQILRYACRDADAARRVFYVLQQRLARVRRYPQHKWFLPAGSRI